MNVRLLYELKFCVVPTLSQEVSLMGAIFWQLVQRSRFCQTGDEHCFYLLLSYTQQVSSLCFSLSFSLCLAVSGVNLLKPMVGALWSAIALERQRTLSLLTWWWDSALDRYRHTYTE